MLIKFVLVIRERERLEESGKYPMHENGRQDCVSTNYFQRPPIRRILGASAYLLFVG